MTKTLFRASVLSLSMIGQASLQAGIIDIPMGGTTVRDGWTNNSLLAVNNTGFPGYPGTGAWPSAGIASDVGSGDATLIKTSNSSAPPPGGGPYPSGSSLYFGGQSFVPNMFGGSVAVQDATPLLGVQTIVFQIVINESSIGGFDFYNEQLPTLSLNGGASIAPTYSSLFDRSYIGEFNTPEGPEPIYQNSYALQWDVSGLGPISSLQIDISAVQHAGIVALQLEQSTQAYAETILPAAIPEPSTTMMFAGVGIVALLRRRR